MLEATYTIYGYIKPSNESNQINKIPLVCTQQEVQHHSPPKLMPNWEYIACNKFVKKKNNYIVREKPLSKTYFY